MNVKDLIATSHFENSELLEILKDLIKCKSDYPHHTEEAIANYINKLFMQNGINSNLHLVREGRLNVVAELEGKPNGKTILYNGHLDTVLASGTWDTDPFDPVIKNGKMFGRGTSDMKGGLAAIIYAAIVLKRLNCPFQGKLLIVFNVDEERENIGMRHFINNNFHADYAIIGEPTNLNICIAHKGVARYRLKTFGKAKHAAHVNEKDENAIINMTKLIGFLQDENKRLISKKDPILGNASLTITKIEGGSAINVIPDSCVVEIDRRLLAGETKDDITCNIHKLLYKHMDENLDYKLENYLFIPASEISRDHILVRKLGDVISRLFKRKAAIGPFTATCEAPFLSVYKGIPTVIFGPGSLEQAHQVNEYIIVDEVVEASKVYMQLILDMLPVKEEEKMNDGY